MGGWEEPVEECAAGVRCLLHGDEIGGVMASKGGAGTAMKQIAKNAESFPRKFVTAAVSDIRKDQTKTLKKDIGGDMGMSGIGNARLTFKSTVKGDSIVTGEVSVGKPRGPWTWLEEGTRPHIAGGRYRGARHPGTRAKRTWSRALPKSVDGVLKKARKELRTIVGR